MKINGLTVPRFVIGLGVLIFILILTYLGCFHTNPFARFVQIIGFCIATGYITTDIARVIVKRLSPVTKYYLKSKKMGNVLIILLASEFVMIFALGMDVTFRTIFLWIFIPVYQLLSKLRAIPRGEDLAEKMSYLPKEGEI